MTTASTRIEIDIASLRGVFERIDDNNGDGRLNEGDVVHGKTAKHRIRDEDVADLQNFNPLQMLQTVSGRRFRIFRDLSPTENVYLAYSRADNLDEMDQLIKIGEFEHNSVYTYPRTVTRDTADEWIDIKADCPATVAGWHEATPPLRDKYETACKNRNEHAQKIRENWTDRNIPLDWSLTLFIAAEKRRRNLTRRITIHEG